jgi:hypothetical protein
MTKELLLDARDACYLLVEELECATALAEEDAEVSRALDLGNDIIGRNTEAVKTRSAK